jgi:DnaJ-class molecular chaperone
MPRRRRTLHDDFPEAFGIIRTPKPGQLPDTHYTSERDREPLPVLECRHCEGTGVLVADSEMDEAAEVFLCGDCGGTGRAV